MRHKFGQMVVMMLFMVSVWIANAMPASAAAPICSFKNPILSQGADPSVIFHEGFYYLVQSNNADFSIGLRKSETLTGLANAENVTIWVAPPNTNYSREIWAPELLALDGGFYIYFAADDGSNDNHRMYALKATSDDLLSAWEFAGPLFKTPDLDKWAIDLSAFEYNDHLYAVWSGSDGDEAKATFPQVLYIAAMSDPLTIESGRIKILTPTEPWETSVAAIAEGPEPYIHNDTVSIIYSADTSWTRQYKLASVELTGEDPLDSASWTKVGPVFEGTTSNQGSVYGVGHNSLPVMSPDGAEWWQIYHAKEKPEDGWEDRDIRIQKMTWNADGTPNFGTPIPTPVAQVVPSGEPCGLEVNLNFDTGIIDLINDPRVVIQGDPQLTAVKAPPKPGGTGTGDFVLVMDGNDVVDLGRPAVNTTGNYTVMARVMLTGPVDDYTFVAQEGGLNSAFRLHTTKDGHFALTMYAGLGGVAAEAISDDVVNSNTWYDLGAVRDAVNGTITLYVDGKVVATAPFQDDFRTVGSVVMGAAKEKGKRQHYMIGMLDNVSLYNGALTAEDLTALAAP